MADEKAEEKESPPAGPKKIMGLPLGQFLFVAANALVMLGGLAFVAWASLIYKKPAITDSQVVREVKRAVAPAEPSDGFFLESYQEMTITLRGQQGGKNRYATVEVSLVCGSENCLQQVKVNRAKVEDAIQSAIGSRSYGELGSLEVKFRVKHEIAGRVNSFLRNTAVVDVLFTNFLIQ
jgi:flagellar basal body-associated protein FliL